MAARLEKHKSGDFIVRSSFPEAGNGHYIVVGTSSSSPKSEKVDWLTISDGDISTILHIEALPQLRRALSLIAQRLKEQKKAAA